MTRRRGLARAVSLATVALLALGACSSGGGKKPAKTEKLTLRVGVLFTTSGKGGDFAQAVLGAAKLAGDDAVKDLDVTVESVQADYAGDPRLIPAAVADLKAKSDAIVVATDDPVVLPHLASLTDVPVVHSLLGVGIPDAPNVFSVAPSSSQQAERLVGYLTTQRKYRRIAVMTDTTAFGIEGRDVLRAAFASAGTEPALELEFAPGGDIHTPVARAGQRAIDAMIVWVDSPGEAARIVVETQRMNFGFQIALSGNLATATFAKNASAQVTPVAFRDGMLSVGPWAGPWFNVNRIVDFYTRFQSENSAQAPVQAASVYDAVAVLAAAARARGGTTGADLITGLEATKDFEGAGVPLSFGADKHLGVDLDDVACYGYTKDQDSAGGEFFPDVDTGGGFFTIVTQSLELPERYRFLTTRV